MRLHFRTKWLRDLGWTVKGNMARPPGDDSGRPGLTVREAADQMGMPQQQADHRDIELLYHWGRHRRNERSRPESALPAHVADERLSQWLEQKRAERAAADEPSVEPQINFVPVEAHLTQRANFVQDARERKADRIESALVQRFTDYLRQQGRDPCGVDIPVGQQVIRADLFDRTTGVLYEAKASPDRQKIRMAIGQLFDYRRRFPDRPELCVLVPESPEQDLRDLLADVGIGAVWPEHGEWLEVEPDRLGTVDLRGTCASRRSTADAGSATPPEVP